MWDYCHRKFGDKSLPPDLLVRFHRRIAGGRWWKEIGHSVGVFRVRRRRWRQTEDHSER